ncbi:putative ATP-dependent endonuclease of OLD family [Methanococcus maripaludis]|uniref:Putative ATP-dependent endonuclease of OLD family n=1 Tax=Methanococcus maripaludis TaxID=39152 RepID=A0A7J9NVA5_METMI|nr:AAA family ATPase [Methanococcus maripaludis]MBA2851599.1 putative ATP-dependent endonuclease of OLD family [Methanococcus maripaludis]
MKLEEITIKNFKSIENCSLKIPELDEDFFLFLGINESGKSNILEAISMLNYSQATLPYDTYCYDENRLHSLDIELKFTFNTEDSDSTLINKISSKIPKELLNLTRVRGVTKTLSINKESKVTVKHYFKDLHVNPEIPLSKYGLENGNIILKPANVQDKPNLIDITPESYLDFINNLLNVELNLPINLNTGKYIPRVTFWKPSANYLINAPVNLEAFGKDPNISLPLKNIFYLAGYKNINLIKEDITRIKNDIHGTGGTFSKKLSDSATEHLNTVWKEHNVELCLNFIPDSCMVLVKDKDSDNRFRMNQRSDGFKHFISILLHISAENKSETLKNTIILLDEPEIHLHPSGTEYLRDELKRISKNNYVFASTHSIFMVDKDNLERHFKVTKTHGVTDIEQIDPEDPLQEEVIYGALGTSIYEIMEKHMIIFEGRTDKDLYDAFTKRFSETYSPLGIKSICATGESNIPKYVKFFVNNKLIKGYVVVDSDKAGRGAIQRIKDEDGEFGNNSFELKNILDSATSENMDIKNILSKKEFVLEDLLPEEMVITEASKFYDHSFPYPENKSIMSHIKTVKKENNITTDGDLKDLKTKICLKVLNDLKALNDDEKVIEKYPVYFEFVKLLHEKLREMNPDPQK